MITELLFTAYFMTSCHNLGESYNYPTEYKIGRGCFTVKGTFLPRAEGRGCHPCSVAPSDKAHEIMRLETLRSK
jgi:hypothetical protein